MSGKHHIQSERLAAEAETALRAGERDHAQRLYARAAKAEEQALADVSKDKVRTRGILSVSASSLFYKAQLFADAERVIFRSLGDATLPRSFQNELRELLDVVADEKFLAEEQHAKYTGDGFVIAMRGGLIGYGTAPLDEFLHTFDGIRSIFFRVAEWVGGRQFRRQGAPQEDVRELLQARVTQPVGGSYRFRIRLVEPQQLVLFDEPRISPSKVADKLFQFVDYASAGKERQLEQAIPDEQYRVALLKLLRNVAPDGKRLGELQFYREGASPGESVLIRRDTKDHIRASLRPSVLQAPSEQTLFGVLRAVDLDGKWVRFTPPGSQDPIRCFAADIILDDVVGPMVNHRVKLTGVRTAGKHLVFHDIELDNGENGSA